MSEELAAVLDRLAAEGREPGGAACVVGPDGEAVAAAGTLGGERPFTADSLVMCYSVAKPLAALTVLSVVAEGRLGLDQPVAEVWPAYAVNGKDRTTVRHVLSHQAGLSCFPPEAAVVEYDDREALIDLLADAVPEHEPGTAVGEHALTYGHLCDALVRGATGDDLADLFARIAADHGWDLHLRVAEADLGRVADVVPLAADWPAVYLDDPSWGPALSRPPGPLDPKVINSRRWRTTSFPAIGLHASVRGLARFFADLPDPAGPVGRLLGPDLHAEYVGPQVTEIDRVIGREVTWTLGFQLDPGEIGMGGAGGCAAWVSTRHGYAAAYISRGLGDHDRADRVWDWAEERYSRT